MQSLLWLTKPGVPCPGTLATSLWAESTQLWPHGQADQPADLPLIFAYTVPSMRAPSRPLPADSLAGLPGGKHEPQNIHLLLVTSAESPEAPTLVSPCPLLFFPLLRSWHHTAGF